MTVLKKMNITKYILLLLATITLSACGSETSSKDIAAPRPTAENFVVTTSTGKKATIDIEPYIYDEQGLDLSLSHVDTDNSQCRASISGNSEITIHPLVNGLCDITYTITNGISPASGKISAVSNNSGNVPFLATISKSAQPNRQIDIDVLTELNALGVDTTGLALMPNISTSSGDASVNSNNIAFTPSLTGVAEIIYTLGDASGNISVGTVAVSVSATSLSPVALPYDYPTPILPDTEITVDIGQLKDQTNTPIISHPQNKPLQLISIKAYGATARSADPNDVTNTAFTLKVPSGAETQDVTYTVTDHDGGYASNIIRFDISTPAFAQAISITADNAFTDGTSQNQARVQVVDKKSQQPIKGVYVSWLSEGGVVLTGSQSQTDSNGYAQIAGTSTKSGSSKLTAIIGSTKTEATWTFVDRPVVRTVFTNLSWASRHKLFVEHDGSAPLWVDWGDGTKEPITSGVKMEHLYSRPIPATLAIEYYQDSQPNITTLDLTLMQVSYALQDLNTLNLTGSLLFSTWTGNDVVGNLADLPRTLTKDLIFQTTCTMCSPIVTGTINDIPKGLTGSLILQQGIDGNLADLPPALEGDLSLMLKSTAGGSAADLPRGLKGDLLLKPADNNSPPSLVLNLNDLPPQLNTTIFDYDLILDEFNGIEIRNLNVVGTASGIPRAATALDIENNHHQPKINISGDVIELPRSLETLWLEGPGDISLTGDIANLPQTLKRFAIVYRFGYLDDPTPSNDNNTLFGDIAYLPQGMAFFKASGQNTITGDVKDIIPPAYQSDADGRPSGLYIAGLNTIEGSINDLPIYDLGYGWGTAPIFIRGRGKKQLTGDLGDFKVISPVDKNYYGNLTHLDYETPSELFSFTCDLASLNESNISSLTITITQQPCDNTLGNQLRLYHLENIKIYVTLNGRTNFIIPYSFVNDLLDAIIASSPSKPGRFDIIGIDNKSLVDQQKVNTLTSQGWYVNLY